MSEMESSRNSSSLVPLLLSINVSTLQDGAVCVTKRELRKVQSKEIMSPIYVAVLFFPSDFATKTLLLLQVHLRLVHPTLDDIIIPPYLRLMEPP